MSTLLKMVKLLLIITLVSACAPKVGSPAWCKAIEAKPKGELTLDEAKDYATHCVFK